MNPKNCIYNFYVYIKIQETFSCYISIAR